MIFAEPALSAEDRKVLELLQYQRNRLRILTRSNPRRWYGILRKSTLAHIIQGSNAIEGYNVTLDEAMAAAGNEPPLDERTEAWEAVNGYRLAMAYITQAADDPDFEFSGQLLKSLHFMMTQLDSSSYPGKWRPGAVRVVNIASGAVEYEAPDVEKVDHLIEELLEYLNEKGHESAFVTAAIAHLNLAMIHPFKDGNGRMARALQTLVLARERIIHPLFSSIEEWLGRNTPEYYDVLREIGKGSWNPSHSALPWVRFCLRAHYQQAKTLIRRHDEYELLFDSVEQLIEQKRLNKRMAVPLFISALGMRITNSSYQLETEVSQYVAGRDSKALANMEILIPHGEKRGRFYTAGRLLSDARQGSRKNRAVPNPCELPEVSSPAAPGLPGF